MKWLTSEEIRTEEVKAKAKAFAAGAWEDNDDHIHAYVERRIPENCLPEDPNTCLQFLLTRGLWEDRTQGLWKGSIPLHRAWTILIRLARRLSGQGPWRDIKAHLKICIEQDRDPGTLGPDLFLDQILTFTGVLVQAEYLGLKFVRPDILEYLRNQSVDYHRNTPAAKASLYSDGSRGLVLTKPGCQSGVIERLQRQEANSLQYVYRYHHALINSDLWRSYEPQPWARDAMPIIHERRVWHFLEHGDDRVFRFDPNPKHHSYEDMLGCYRVLLRESFSSTDGYADNICFLGYYCTPREVMMKMGYDVPEHIEIPHGVGKPAWDWAMGEEYVSACKARHARLASPFESMAVISLDDCPDKAP